MEKAKKIKIFVGIFYLILLSAFLFIIFSKFNFAEVASYQFIQLYLAYFLDFKNTNLTFVIIVFAIATIFWVFLLGIVSPVAFIGGLFFGKWLGTLIVSIGLSLGAILLYIFVNYFFKDLIKEKFLFRFKNLKSKFKKNEFNFMFLFRFIGGIPFPIANLLPALFNVSIKNYFIGTFFGMMPQLFIIVSLGSGIEKIINQNETVPSVIDLLFSSEIYTPIISFILLVIITGFARKMFFKS